jgi:hypothetical protein
MPVTADDLWLINTDATDRGKVEKALDYIQTAMPENGAPVVREFAQRDIQVSINHNGDVNYNATTKTLNWDPNLGLTLYDDEGGFIGVSSAAANLLHERNHALDPDIEKNVTEPNLKWGDDAERAAIQRTNEATREAGEPERVNHQGDFVRAPDPTEHTEHWEQLADGNSGGQSELVWVEQDTLSSADIYGDVFEMADLSYGMPSIGGGSGDPLMPEIGPDSTSPPAEQAMAVHIPVVLVGTAPDAHFHGSFMLM